VETQVSRTYKDIIVKNVLTTFNLLLFFLGAVFVVLGLLNDVPSQSSTSYINALATTGVIVLNIIIATIQEMKAKRRLDNIALLLRPKVRVMRGGEELIVDQNEIVKDDIIHLESGDQALVDGVLVSIRSLEMDESLLTGESRTVRKKVDETVYSGSYCITGEGHYTVTAFGDDSYASKMLASAKRFENKKSPLQAETGAVTKMLMIIAFIYLGIVLLGAVLRNTSGTTGGQGVVKIVEAIAMKAAAILDIVPIALFLLIVIAYMVAAVRMADSGVLLQRSNAVESMSHVDTVCMDKTGTITTNKLIFEELIPLQDDEREAEHFAKLFASATSSRNKTIDAMSKHFGTVNTEVTEEIMFSSERKFSAVRVNDGSRSVSLYMGAFPVLRGSLTHGDKKIEETIRECSKKGLRTVLLAKGNRSPFYENGEPVIPTLRPIALITISDEIRPDCRDTIELFLRNNMDLKVISGDDPETVDAIFSIAEIPGERKILSGDEFDRMEGEERTKAILETNIFGRMRPDNKDEIVSTLKANGRYVAMVGDGVNDVKALKRAQVGVALESGSGAARGVADIVLMDDRFSALPKALVEGKRTVSGMRDILKLYLARNFVLVLIIPITLLLFNGAVPFIPTGSMFYAFVSVSITAFLMVIWAQPSDKKGAVLPDVFKFAIPSAVLLAIFGMLVYILFHFGTDMGWMDFGYTDPVRDNLFWNASGWNSLDPGSIDLDRMMADREINARNAMLLFLTLAGVLQLLFIAPPKKFFSIDGNVSKDIKPAILVLLLVLLIMTAYTQPAVMEILRIALLGDWKAAVFILVGVWFFTARYVLRKGKFGMITNVAELAYKRSLRREREKMKDASVLPGPAEGDKDV
jgi:cation-transporting ATPase E